MHLLQNINKSLFKQIYCADKAQDLEVYHLIDETQIYELSVIGGIISLSSTPKRYSRISNIRKIYQNTLSQASLQEAVDLLHDNKSFYLL